MSDDGSHDFINRYMILPDNEEIEEIFYKIQSHMEPANLDMIEPVLDWIKMQIKNKNYVIYNEYTCNPPKHIDLKTINAIADAISGL